MSSPLRQIAVGAFLYEHQMVAPFKNNLLNDLVDQNSFYRKDTIICLHNFFSLTLHPITNTEKRYKQWQQNMIQASMYWEVFLNIHR